MRPSLSELIASARVLSIPMRARFRGITERELVVFEGPHGWGEWGPFLEYGDEEAAVWLISGLEAAYLPALPRVRDSIAINATVPNAPLQDLPGLLEPFSGVNTVKLKVGTEAAGALDAFADDLGRVQLVSELLPAARLRLDANGSWDPDLTLSFLMALKAIDIPLERIEYLEQPCATIAEMAEVHNWLTSNGVPVKLAADESVRRASDPLRVAREGAADILVFKVAPLGGVRSALSMASAAGLPVVISSALESSIGMVQGLRLAAGLPELDYACGLGTVTLLAGDTCRPSLVPENGFITASEAGFEARPDPALLERHRASADRERWWLTRLERCFAQALAGFDSLTS